MADRLEIPEEVLYDQRLVDRHIAKGYLTREQADKHLKGLADVAEQSGVIDLETLDPRSRGKSGSR